MPRAAATPSAGVLLTLAVLIALGHAVLALTATTEKSMTADEIAPNQELKLVTRLNGEVVQSSHTGHMIFPIAKLISYASTIFTLVPGDVIATGTPAGVGWSRKPAWFMKPGDVCEVEIEGIGTLVNPIVAQA